MNTVHKIVSALIVLLGLAHCGFTFLNYSGLSMDAFWFLGAGIAIVLAGFLNVALIRVRGRDTVIWLMTLLTNLAFLLLFGLATFMLRESQVFVGLALFFLAALRTFFLDTEASNIKD